MAFSLPDFNLTADFYAWGAPPPGGAVLFSSVCAWVQPRRSVRWRPAGLFALGEVPSTFLLLPVGLTIKTFTTTNLPAVIRLRGMAGCLMGAVHQTIVGAGHDNEHLQLECTLVGFSWPNLIPSPTPN